jgi:hypothetical protein
LTAAASSSIPKRKPPLPPKERFKVAREHEVDETGKEFERPFNKVVPTKRTHRPKRSD